MRELASDKVVSELGWGWVSATMTVPQEKNRTRRTDHTRPTHRRRGASSRRLANTLPEPQEPLRAAKRLLKSECGERATGYRSSRSTAAPTNSDSHVASVLSIPISHWMLIRDSCDGASRRRCGASMWRDDRAGMERAVDSAVDLLDSPRFPPRRGDDVETGVLMNGNR